MHTNTLNTELQLSFLMPMKRLHSKHKKYSLANKRGTGLIDFYRPSLHQPQILQMHTKTVVVTFLKLYLFDYNMHPMISPFQCNKYI